MGDYVRQMPSASADLARRPGVAERFHIDMPLLVLLLILTAFGLIVAIPALLFWRGLKSRVNHLQLELELESARFLRLAPDETLA